MDCIDFRGSIADVSAYEFIRNGNRVYGVIQPCVSYAASDGGEHGGCDDEGRWD